jgi:predicted O-linked N-acetylglucosamine transferase (SPINDLY family)
VGASRERQEPGELHGTGLAAGFLVNDADAFGRALDLFQRGRLDGAAALCRDIVRRDPAQADAWHVLGIVALQQSRTDEGIELIRRSLAINPRHVVALCSLGNGFRDRQQPAEALEHYQRALALAPDFAGAHYAAGNALLDLGRAEEALASFDRAIALHPGYLEARQNRGNACLALGRTREALESYQRALALQPDFVAALNNSGLLLRQLGRPGEAIAHYDRLLALTPGDAGAWLERGHCLMSLDRAEQALSSFDQAVSISPNDASALDARGVALRTLKRFEEALQAFDLALAVLPDSPDLHYRRAVTLRNLRRHEDAALAFARVMRIDPHYDFALGNLLHERLQVCDWTDYADLLDRVQVQLRQGWRVYLPGPFLSVSNDAADQLRCARQFVAAKLTDPSSAAATSPAGAAASITSPRASGERIRVAYVSADFRDHPVSQLLAGVIEAHDRERFEIIAVSLQPAEESPLGARMHDAFDRFIDVARRTDREVSALLRDMNIDIAVDLMGYSGGSRPAIFVPRAAPVQVNFLGFSGTLGAEHMDYLIADARVIPESRRASYTEKIAYLPHCFQPNGARPVLADRRPARADWGLPERAFVFCCFNKHYKISPAVFAVWMRLLRAVDGSVLWLPEGGDTLKANLRRVAVACDVAPERLLFASRVPELADHLARYRLADLFLDTLPYNAHTTASDALWAGLPLLTCRGGSFAARVAASLLEALDLPELISGDLREYEASALRFATEPAVLGALRARLASSLRTSALFDTAGYTRDLESVFTKMVERHRAGLPPLHLTSTP